jgi:redox-regulated HSP33 family molecular chaperone
MGSIRPGIMYECVCGEYSLKAALNFLSQAEISKLMEAHIRAVHLGVTDERE